MASHLTINSTVKLNSGYELPRLGFGVYQTPPDQAQSICTMALDVGYRHVSLSPLSRKLPTFSIKMGRANTAPDRLGRGLPQRGQLRWVHHRIKDPARGRLLHVKGGQDFIR